MLLLILSNLINYATKDSFSLKRFVIIVINVETQQDNKNKNSFFRNINDRRNNVRKQ